MLEVIYIFTHQNVFMACCLIKQEIAIHDVVLSLAQGQLYIYFTLPLP
jgi:hypothetical protein